MELRQWLGQLMEREQGRKRRLSCPTVTVNALPGTLERFLLSPAQWTALPRPPSVPGLDIHMKSADGDSQSQSSCVLVLTCSLIQSPVTRGGQRPNVYFRAEETGGEKEGGGAGN